MKSWDDFFMERAEMMASRSKDPSTQVGAVIVNPEMKHVVGEGYNGFPRGIRDLPERYHNRPLKYEMVVHAEVNAIIDAGREARGCTLYSTFMPCPQCAALIIQAGIKRVFALVNPSDDRWKDKAHVTQTMFDETGIELKIVLGPSCNV